MGNIKIDKLTEYKYVYDQINHRREYLSSKLVQMITIYTAETTVYFRNLMKYINPETNYSIVKNIIITIFLFISGIILIKDLIVTIYINAKFSSNYVSAQDVLDTFKESSTPEITQSYSREKIRLNVYKNLCNSYIKAAIKNEEILDYIAPKQKRTFVSIFINLILIAIIFCMVSVVF